MSLTDLWPVLSTGVPILMTVAGWIWILSGKASTVVYLERRISALEQTSTRIDDRLDHMADRLARLEPMLQFVVGAMKNTRLP